MSTPLHQYNLLNGDDSVQCVNVEEANKTRPRCLGTGFEARRWLSTDPCGLLCASIVVLLHTFSWGVIFDSLLGSSVASKIIFYVFYSPLAVTALYCQFLTWTTDPGSVPMGAKPYEVKREDQSTASAKSTGSSTDVESSDGECLPMTYEQRFPRGVRRCKKCKGNFKPSRAHHDSVTGRCVVKLDHYCPWVGNAVGIRNHKVFLLFIFYTFMTTVFAAVLIIMRFSRCGFEFDADSEDSSSEDTDDLNFRQSIIRRLDAVYPGCDDSDDDPLVFQGEVLTLIIINICAFLFTLVMMFDQYEAVTLSISKIARMKISAEASYSSMLHRVIDEYNEVFGGSSDTFQYHWLIPRLVQFPEDKSDLLLGYELHIDAYEKNVPWRFENEKAQRKRYVNDRSTCELTDEDSPLSPSFAQMHAQIGSQLGGIDAIEESKDEVESLVASQSFVTPLSPPPGLGRLDEL